MKTIEEIRLDNLRALVNEAGGVTRFAETSGKQQAQISQLLNRAKDSKTGKPKAIGSSQARELEKAANKETGWLDNDHSREPIFDDEDIKDMVSLMKRLDRRGRITLLAKAEEWAKGSEEIKRTGT
ncbi:hypothetical protein ACLIIZ_03655 [Azonexus caeni]|uniref:hypothetical protein n=1 Tax=Azonexus caeni TaxID=266126 RepID=UPI003A89491E